MLPGDPGPETVDPGDPDANEPVDTNEPILDPLVSAEMIGRIAFLNALWKSYENRGLDTVTLTGIKNQVASNQGINVMVGDEISNMLLDAGVTAPGGDNPKDALLPNNIDTVFAQLKAKHGDNPETAAKMDQAVVMAKQYALNQNGTGNVVKNDFDARAATAIQRARGGRVLQQPPQPGKAAAKVAQTDPLQPFQSMDEMKQWLLAEGRPQPGEEPQDAMSRTYEKVLGMAGPEHDDRAKAALKGFYQFGKVADLWALFQELGFAAPVDQEVIGEIMQNNPELFQKEVAKAGLFLPSPDCGLYTVAQKDFWEGKGVPPSGHDIFSEEDILMKLRRGEDAVVARWESAGGKDYVELIANANGHKEQMKPYSFRARGAGGFLGLFPGRTEAIAALEPKLEYMQADKNKTPMRRVQSKDVQVKTAAGGVGGAGSGYPAYEFQGSNRYCPKIRNVVNTFICRYHCLDGLKIDDAQVVCGEAIWRQTVADKFSREYRNTDGEWVGGYLNKRFEIHRDDGGHPYQLKPGRRSAPIHEEAWSPEKRLVEMRKAEGEARNYRPKSKERDDLYNFDQHKLLGGPGSSTLDAKKRDPIAKNASAGGQARTAQTDHPNIGMDPREGQDAGQFLSEHANQPMTEADVQEMILAGKAKQEDFQRMPNGMFMYKAPQQPATPMAASTWSIKTAKPRPGPGSFGRGHAPNCKCEDNFTCQECLQTTVDRNMADANTTPWRPNSKPYGHKPNDKKKLAKRDIDDKFDSCVEQVKAKGDDVNPYAVCMVSTGKGEKRKGKKKAAAFNLRRIAIDNGNPLMDGIDMGPKAKECANCRKKFALDYKGQCDHCGGPLRELTDGDIKAETHAVDKPEFSLDIPIGVTSSNDIEVRYANGVFMASKGHERAYGESATMAVSKLAAAPGDVDMEELGAELKKENVGEEPQAPVQPVEEPPASTVDATPTTENIPMAQAPDPFEPMRSDAAPPPTPAKLDAAAGEPLAEGDDPREQREEERNYDELMGL